MSRNSLCQVDPSVVDADPFWAAAVASHPGATYVLLPPDPPAREVPPDRVAAAEGAVTATWRGLQRYVEAAGHTDAPTISWRGSPGTRRLVARTALIGIGRERGIELAARLGVSLGAQGWLLRTDRGAEVTTLRARGPRHDRMVEVEVEVEVDVAVGDGATVLSITCPAAVA